MAKVEMSLNEYNEMKEELDFLHRVVREITTPVVSDWDKDYYGKSHLNHNLRAELTPEVKKYLESQVNQHLPKNDYSDESAELKVNFSNPLICSVDYVEAPADEEEEIEGEDN